MPYVDQLQVRVLIRDGMWVADEEGSPVIQEFTESVYWSGTFSVDALDEVLGRQVFELAGQPFAFKFSIRTTNVEQGGSSAWAEVVIELLQGSDGAAGAAWSVLAALVAKFLLDWLNQNGDGGEGQV